jgi:hypothetical protein
MKLNANIKLAIARYFLNRDSQCKKLRVEGTSMELITYDADAPKWDKEGDLSRIAELARKANMSFTACCGTFWFGKGKRVIECNEGNYLDNGITTKAKPAKAA